MPIRFDQFTPQMAMPQMAPTQTRPTMQGLLGALTGGDGYGEMVSDDARKAAQRQGLLAFGSQMLQASGPSPVRTSLGQALGQGITAGMGAQQQGLQQALQAQLMQSQIARNEQQRLPSGIQEYEFAKANGFEGTFEDWKKISIAQARDPASIQEYNLARSQGYDKPFDQWLRDRAQLGVGAPYQMGEMAGGRGVFDRTTGGFSPRTSAQDEATGAATIAGETARATSKSRADVEKEVNQSNALRAVEYTVSETRKFAEQARRLRDHPGLRAATGFGGETLSKVPGTQAANAAAELDNLKNIAFIAALSAMRAASPTGGAVGNVSNAEGTRFENAYTALSQAQTYDQFTRNLDRMIEMMDESEKRIKDAYERDYPTKGSQSDSPGKVIDWSDL